MLGIVLSRRRDRLLAALCFDLLSERAGSHDDREAAHVAPVNLSHIRIHLEIFVVIVNYDKPCKK